MTAPTRYLTAADLRDDALRDTLGRIEDVTALLQLPGSHVTAETITEAWDAWDRVRYAFERLAETQKRVDACACKCPTYTAETRQAAREALAQREALRGMANDIGEPGYEWAWERS